MTSRENSGMNGNKEVHKLDDCCSDGQLTYYCLPDKKKRLKKTCGGNKIGPAVGSNGIGTRRQSSAVNRNDSDMDISDEVRFRLTLF